MTETAKEATTKTTTKKAAAPRAVKAVRKSNKGKQKNLVTSRGFKFIAGFPGNAKLDEITDDSMLESGAASDALRFAAYMDPDNEIIIDPDVSFALFDKQIPAKLKRKQIKITEADGSETTYQFKFPGIENFTASGDKIKDHRGSLRLTSEWLDAAVITTPKIKKVDYWDEHAGRRRVIEAAMSFLKTAEAASEFDEVMALTESFLSKLQF